MPSNPLVVAFIISIVVLLLYVPALKNDFVNMDDGDYVINNTAIHSFDINMLKFLFTFHSANWHPLTWLSHAVDYLLWGLNPLGHHLTNIVLHSLNTLLVMILSYLLTNLSSGDSALSSKRSFFVASVAALLFGIHPVHVESVAWVSERKDVLCAFFFLLSLILYLKYATEHQPKKRIRYYIASLSSFLLALMSKPMAVTLPAILLLMDVYPLNRITLNRENKSIKSVLLEKIPFFLFTTLSIILTMLAQSYGGALRDLEAFTVENRILVALKTIIFYITKLIYPIGLSPFYPYPKGISPFNLEFLIPIFLITIISVLTIIAYKRGNKIFALFWSFYLITLLPVSGIIQVGSQAAADRYTYIPTIGFFILFGNGAYLVRQRLITYKKTLSNLFLSLLGVVFIFLSTLTVQQIGVWKNSLSLWTKAIEVFPNYPNFYEKRALGLFRAGDYMNALKDLDTAISIKPDFINAYIAKGEFMMKRGDYASAIDNYTKAETLLPRDPEILNNRAIIHFMLGNFKEGLRDLDRIIEIEPNFWNAYYNKCQAYSLMKDLQQTLQTCTKALQIRPEQDKTFIPKHSVTLIGRFENTTKVKFRYDVVHYFRGTAYFNGGFTDKAIDDFTEAIKLNPSYAEAYYARALAYLQKDNNKRAALADLQEAARLGFKEANRSIKQLQGK